MWVTQQMKDDAALTGSHTVPIPTVTPWPPLSDLIGAENTPLPFDRENE